VLVVGSTRGVWRQGDAFAGQKSIRRRGCQLSCNPIVWEFIDAFAGFALPPLQGSCYQTIPNQQIQLEPFNCEQDTRGASPWHLGAKGDRTQQIVAGYWCQLRHVVSIGVLGRSSFEVKK